MTEATVWHGGRIWTGRRFVERVIAEGGRIVAADDGGAAGPEVPQGAERVDLAGRPVVPGLVDAHLHPTEAARAEAGVELRGVARFEEIGERLRAASGERGGPLWGGGWDQERWPGHRTPDRRDLDRWVADRPVVLTRICGHVAVASSAALEIMGIDRTVHEPPGGAIDRDADGEPTGVLRERALRHLERFPFPSLRERPDLGERFLARCAAWGIAAIAGLRASPEELDWFRSRPATSAPGPSYVAFGNVGDLGSIEEWAAARRAGASELVGVKLFADGSFGARGAWLRRPYADAADEAGGPLWPPSQWIEAIERADALGLRVAAHALGDRALATVLDALESARPALRPRIEHAGLAPPDLLDRLASRPLDVVVQPGFRTSDRWLIDRLGPSRLAHAYPFGTLRRRGVALAGSSDAPVESYDPVDGMRSAVDPSGVGTPMSSLDALGLYTTGGASALGRPELGSLEPGSEANLVAFAAPSLDEVLRPTAGPALRTVWLRGRRVGVPPAGAPPRKVPP